MRATEISARLNGAGVVRSDPKPRDVKVAKKVISFVEGRRVLFSSHTMEVPVECIYSVIEIRNFLSDVIGSDKMTGDLERSLKLARGYCVRFLEQVQASEMTVPKKEADRYLHHDTRWRMQDYTFGEALGELRAGVGLQVGIMAASTHLDVEDQLAAQIPDAR